MIMILTNPESRAIWESMSDAEHAAGYGAHMQLRDSMIAAGELVLAEALDGPETARRVRVRDGRVVTTDGPFAEVKEHLAGFYLVECDSMDKAVEYAVRVPDAEAADVEVRPVLDLRGTEM